MRSPEIHSKWRYKICICSVILVDFKSFRNYKGFSIVFPENFRCNLSFYERENFSDSYLNHTFESEHFRFLFSTKNSITWGGKSQKFTLQKIVGNLLDKFRKLYMNAWMNGHLKVCAAPSGRAFASRWSENGYTLCPFWHGIGYGFRGNY